MLFIPLGRYAVALTTGSPLGGMVLTGLGLTYLFVWYNCGVKWSLELERQAATS